MLSGRLSLFFLIASVCLSWGSAIAQENQDNQPHITPRKEEKASRPVKPTPSPTPEAEAPAQQPPAAAEESGGDSSSKDSQIDLNAGPTVRRSTGTADDGEFKPYDPHRAEKDIEVGKYYLKLKNYRAALDRFHDALLYKPNDAEATYGLAVTQEKLDLLSEAYKSYSKYLEILPKGPTAKEAEEAMKRIEPRIDSRTLTTDAALRAKEALQEGEKHLANNEYDAARENFENAMRLTPEDPVVYFRLAQSLRGMQRLDSARMYYQKYLDVQPNGEFASDARKAIAQLRSTR